MAMNERLALPLAGFVVLLVIGTLVAALILARQQSPEELRYPPIVPETTIQDTPLPPRSGETELDSIARSIHDNNIRAIRKVFPHLDPDIEEKAETELEIQQITRAYRDLLEGKR